jgi:hypothetical protein
LTSAFEYTRRTIFFLDFLANFNSRFGKFVVAQEICFATIARLGAFWRAAQRSGFGAERIWVVVDYFPTETEMSDNQREIYHSENGDRWLLSRDDDGRAFVLHKANPSSGGKVSSIELGDFLGADKAGPEHQALIRLIGSLVERRPPMSRGTGECVAVDTRQAIVRAETGG